ncbi:CaaX farnesyltransferase beta subunit Ram1 [Histoplasma capsulatum G186AR]|uniref:CaaX farnesyltransferase beta subunit Ram1 n=1 Tax=Ajellomyces capsulatus (strain G186AR / H82 / ATCC MYA-2454 / RMSCC 2432) TaxID=447093 RepID=C0NMX9_AJECG|nr:CaaX farnesyltransferase beta subunit Ram1 [Histoplasma capsulatum G186AR]EEH07227.1 CaaX farnesyltransferase beta subunit Ram1 [Histoplasma capsulatum G186AR]
MADNNKSSQNKGTIKAQYQQKRLNESTKAYDKYINAFLKKGMIRGKYRRKVRFPTTTSNNKESSPRAASSPAHPRTTRRRLHGSSAAPSNLEERHKQQALKTDSSPHTTREPSAAASLYPHSHGKRRKRKNKDNMAAPQSLHGQYQKSIPDLFTQLPLIRDQLVTETSKTQDATIDQCLPFLKGLASSQTGPFNQFGVPRLDRDAHISFLYDSLESYPERFVGLDSSRPWMVYWALTGLYLLGEDVTKFRERVIATAAPMQNSTGGFGGGHGQMSHCASSYALVLSLALVGGQDAFKLINRTAMWQWLGKLKQADGGFQVTLGGEEDVRGAYCAMVMIALLDLPLQLPLDSPARHAGFDTFVSGLPEYLSRCQTFEGGISGSPGTEAHGAYAFCALACLCILGDPKEMIKRFIYGSSALNIMALSYTACSGRNPDSYHTCYILAGLSTAQHHHFHTGIASAGEPNNPFPSAFSWSHAPATASTEQGQSSIVFNEEDRLEVVHPLFVIPHRAAGKLREWCQKHPLQI